MSGMSVVVFDLDGTLVDSEHRWDEVRRALAAEDGVPWPEQATRAMMGMSTQEWSAYLVEVVGLPSTAAQAAERTISAVADLYHRNDIPILPGAVEAVRRLAEQWTLGVASSSARLLIDAAIAELGVGELIATSLSTEEINGVGKPAPDVYLEVCRRLGADPRLSVAVEDAPNGIRSAQAAGMIVIAVPPHFSPPDAALLASADAVIDTLESLSVELVSDLIAARR